MLPPYHSINMNTIIHIRQMGVSKLMFDDFFIRALIAGVGIAIVAGPLGCLVIWRRLSYFGDTLSHSALLGVTLAYSFSLNIAFSVFVISAVVALLLVSLQKRTKLAGDSLLGLLAHSTLAIGLVLIGFLSYIRFDLMGLLFGDILAVTTAEITKTEKAIFKLNEYANVTPKRAE